MKKPSLPQGVYRRIGHGQESFLVSLGRDEKGKQRWKSCKTLAEATTQRELFLHAKQQQGEGLWMVNASQRADAVAALDILKDHPAETLVNAATFYRKNYLSLIRTESVAALVDKYVDEQIDAGMRLNSARDLRCRMGALKERFGSRLITELTAEDMKRWHKELKQQGKGDLSRRHILNRGCSFFKWAIANNYCVRNPLDPVAVKRPRIYRGEIQFFDVEQCEKILEVFTKHGMGNYAVLGLFCGIRPTECQRLQSRNFHIDGDRIVIKVDAKVTKTVWRRVLELERGTPLGDAVWAWLGGNGKLELPEKIVSSEMTWRRRFADIRKEFDFEWVDDGLRHTAATMFFALTRDESKTSALLGHTSCEMLRMHYKGLTTESEAKKFYALRPE
jgi:integrase